MIRTDRSGVGQSGIGAQPRSPGPEREQSSALPLNARLPRRLTAAEIINQVENLVPISSSALELIALLDQPFISNDDVVEVVKCDNVFTAKLLRACNSPFFGLEEPVSSVEQAVLIVGHAQILHFALAIAFHGPMTAPVPGYAQEAKDLWRHSLITALAAEQIARSNPTLEVESSVAFTAGLLHDIGQLVLCQALPSNVYAALRARVSEGFLSRAEAEKDVIGVDHAEVGKYLLQKWHLPEPILEAVAHHHQPVYRPRPRLSALVHAADCIAYLNGSDSNWERFAVHADAGTLNALGVTRDRLDDLVNAIQDSLHQIENLMGLG